MCTFQRTEFGSFNLLAEIKHFSCNCRRKVNAYKIIQIESYVILKFIRQHENVEYFNYLGSPLTNDAKGTCEIKSCISTSEAAFNNKKTFYQQTVLKFMKETSEALHLENISVWFRNLDTSENRLDSCEMWCGEERRSSVGRIV